MLTQLIIVACLANNLTFCVTPVLRYLPITVTQCEIYGMMATVQIQADPQYENYYVSWSCSPSKEKIANG